MIRVSVILSTYDSPDWLAKVLLGYATQTHPDFEIVIADDGSSRDTAALIDEVQSGSGFSLQHVWQQHRGFRKCRIVNRAILAARGEYLIFSDGDCIPRRDFIAQHIHFASPRRFLSGGVVRLPLALSQQITSEDILNGHIFRADSLLKLGMPFTPKLRFLMTQPTLARALERLSTTRATFNGCNSSAWKADVVRANGFDERMHYGGLDRELGERLMNAGIRPLSIRHQTTCLHLDHQRNYVHDKSVAANRGIRQETRRLRCTRTSFGLTKCNVTPPASLTDSDDVQSQDEETILAFPRDRERYTLTRSLPSRRAA